jgi:hypothetical protein
VTQIERQPGVAPECSHANGGLVAISQAATWSAGRAVQNLQDHRAARRADPDPPLPAAAHLALRPRLPVRLHARRLLRRHPPRPPPLALQLRSPQGGPRGDRRPVRRRHRRRPQGLSEPERAPMTSASSWMTSAAPFITLTPSVPAPVRWIGRLRQPASTLGTATLTVHCGDRPCERCGRHEQAPNHGAPPTLVVAIAAASLEPDDDMGCRVARPCGWLRRLR